MRNEPVEHRPQGPVLCCRPLMGRLLRPIAACSVWVALVMSWCATAAAVEGEDSAVAPAESEGPQQVPAQGANAPRGQTRKLQAKRLEVAILPALSVSTDTGVGLGVFSQFSRFLPGRDPYAWVLQAQAKMSMKEGPVGLELPLQEHFVTFDKPGLLDGKLRLYVRTGFERNIIAGWYGLGNATTDDTEDVPRRFQYRTESPHASLKARYAMLRKLSVFVGASLHHQATDPYSDSRLAEDIQASEDGTGETLYGYEDHYLSEFQVGTIWESRDHEVSPSAGSFHEISVRGSPGAMTSADHNYVGVNVSTNNFFSLVGEYLIFGFRLTGDIIQGQVPFYMLARTVGLKSINALGSELGVRGVPSSRYTGKVKVYANTELRSTFLHFPIGGEDFGIGASVFFDTGRVWYDLTPHPELDGTGLGLKYGIGGGPQILWGEALVIRFDTAYSPDAHPVGFYMKAGRAF